MSRTNHRDKKPEGEEQVGGHEPTAINAATDEGSTASRGAAEAAAVDGRSDVRAGGVNNGG